MKAARKLLVLLCCLEARRQHLVWPPQVVVQLQVFDSFRSSPSWTTNTSRDKKQAYNYTALKAALPLKSLVVMIDHSASYAAWARPVFILGLLIYCLHVPARKGKNASILLFVAIFWQKIYLLVSVSLSANIFAWRSNFCPSDIRSSDIWSGRCITFPLLMLL